jgi:hypothetical protein
MGTRAPVLASTATAIVLAPMLLALSACSPGPLICAGQCGPPFQLQVVFQQGISKRAAITAMSTCRTDPVIIRIGQPHRVSPSSPTQWNATIYTKKIGRAATHSLLACLRHSPAVLNAAWPS